NSIPAARAFYFVSETAPAKAVAFARAVFHAGFGEGRDCSDPAVLSALAADLGLDPAALTEALGGAAVRERLRLATAEARAYGVFGAPVFRVDDELFWGADRLDQLGRWLARGGW